MTLVPWLEAREPTPPAPLAAALRKACDERAGTGGAKGQVLGEGSPAVADEIAKAARERLELALARPGRNRESAYRLLEADALFTYACEAALERGGSSLALRRILTIASG